MDLSRRSVPLSESNILVCCKQTQKWDNVRQLISFCKQFKNLNNIFTCCTGNGTCPSCDMSNCGIPDTCIMTDELFPLFECSLNLQYSINIWYYCIVIESHLISFYHGYPLLFIFSHLLLGSCIACVPVLLGCYMSYGFMALVSYMLFCQALCKLVFVVLKCDI